MNNILADSRFWVAQLAWLAVILAAAVATQLRGTPPVDLLAASYAFLTSTILTRYVLAVIGFYCVIALAFRAVDGEANLWAFLAMSLAGTLLLTYGGWLMPLLHNEVAAALLVIGIGPLLILQGVVAVAWAPRPRSASVPGAPAERPAAGITR
jgi:hypothetical protein